MPEEARAAAEAARDFCVARGLVTIPVPARLGHVELVGDDMARSYPFAAYSWRKATADGESGRYMVSPGATWMDAAQREERLRGNCRAWTRVVAAHETWPGHHLQFWVADHETSRLRRAAGSDCFVEGWGLYCEWLLDRHGYFDRPAERLALLAMRAWRASRVVLDVRLHCAGLPPEEGIAFLVENAASTRDGATAEVTRYILLRLRVERDPRAPRRRGAAPRGAVRREGVPRPPAALRPDSLPLRAEDLRVLGRPYRSAATRRPAIA